MFIGNWKMNGGPGTVDLMASALDRGLAKAWGMEGIHQTSRPGHQDSDPSILNEPQNVSLPRWAASCVIAPPSPLLSLWGRAIEERPFLRWASSSGGLALAAQDCHPRDQGAFTGDVAAPLLKELGCSFCLVGHSERRQYHRETSVQVAEKVAACWRSGLTAVLCVGTSHTQPPAAGETLDLGLLEEELRGSLPSDLPTWDGSSQEPDQHAHLTRCDRRPPLVVAYEPVWAIGTGLTAAPGLLAPVFCRLRTVLKDIFPDLASPPLLYGGSVNADNVDLFQPLTAGVLVGGASLQPTGVLGIIRSLTVFSQEKKDFDGDLPKSQSRGKL